MIAPILGIETRLEDYAAELAGLTKELGDANANIDTLSGRFAEIAITDQRNN